MKKKCSVEKCTGTTSLGDVCKWHLENLYHLDIRTSGIKNSGFGLFTTIDRPKKNHVCDFKGIFYQTPPPGNSTIKISKNKYLDTSNRLSCVARFANRGITSADNNAKIVVSHYPKVRARIMTTKKVNKGDEIFVQYGTSYRIPRSQE